MEANLKHQSGLYFKVQIRDHQLDLDAKLEAGGGNHGPSPKEMVLAAVAGCSGMDVASLLTKMRIPYTSLEVTASADLTETHPKVFKEIVLTFKLEGENLSLDKVQKSVDMSLTTYCGVSAMVHRVSPVRYVIELNGKKAAEGQAQFKY